MDIEPDGWECEPDFRSGAVLNDREKMEFDLNGHEFITLNNLLKVLSLVGTGGEANIRIENGEVIVNGAVETRKRKKLRAGDTIKYGKTSVNIINIPGNHTP